MPFSSRQLKRLRKVSEEWMLASCHIERPAYPTFNDTTGEAEYDQNASLVYEGKCRITPAQGDREVAVGDEVVSLRDVVFYIPYDSPLPNNDDVITVDEAQDSALVGRAFRITDVRMGETNVSRRLSAVTISPSRTADNVPKT